MPDDAVPVEVDPSGDRAALGALAHRMNNALAYAVTNLNLVAEELEALQIPREDRARILQLIDSAAGGAGRASDLVRELKVLSWGEPEPIEHNSDTDDTWDTGGAARILVIDDEPQILSAVSRALRRYDVQPAGGGRQAQAILSRSSNFDVVLCDVMMRDVDGMALYRWLRQHHPQLVPALVFMTAGAFTREIRQFLASVPNTVLHKPFDTKTLRWVVAQKIRGEQR